MFGVHSIKNGLPTTVRAQITDWMVFKVSDPKLINTIHAEAANSEGYPEHFDHFFRNTVDGKDVRFLMINKKENPTQARFNWGLKGKKFGLKDMLDTYVRDHLMPSKETHQYTDGRGKKRSMEIELEPKKKFKYTDGSGKKRPITVDIDKQIKKMKAK